MRSRIPWLWVWVFAILPLMGWWLTGLTDLDEGFYGAVVSEMNARGEWITPFYNGRPWFEKPILLYWMAKPFVMLFGPQIGCRLPSILATIGTYIWVVRFARRHISEHASALAALVLGSSLLVVAIGRMMITDAILVFCLSGAMFTFWDSLHGDQRRRLWTAGLLGLAVLAKGPVSLILFSLIAGITYWQYKDLRPEFRRWWVVGTLFLGVVISAWYVPAYLVNGQKFVKEFLIDQNIGRFTGGDAAHSIGFTGLLIYPILILIGLLPWSVLWAIKARREGAMATDPLVKFCAIWAGVVFVFFTISGAKLPHYILPAFPPLALIIARRLDLPDSGYVFGGRALCFGVALVANFGFLTWYGQSGQQEAHAAMRWIRAQSPPPHGVSVYRMGRQELDRGTGSTTLKETSLPSLVSELGQPLEDTEDLAVVGKTRFMLTRKGRMTPDRTEEARRLGFELKQEKDLTKPGNFEVYRVSILPSR